MKNDGTPYPTEVLTAQMLCAHYRSILEDSSLAEQGIPITDEETGDIVDVAIPVGGKWKSGYLEIPLADKAAERIIEYMQDIAGFENARLEGGGHVAWGEPIPGTGEDLSEEMIITRGRLFGYREDAIRKAVKASKHRNGFARMFRRMAEDSKREVRQFQKGEK
ncbi:MAG TPA: DUF6302 family protein [Candidatus Saccharimonadales bacterium]|nr:DUF6302 family protein [Candidatus Saccharimonadales bacterium]